MGPTWLAGLGPARPVPVRVDTVGEPPYDAATTAGRGVGGAGVPLAAHGCHVAQPNPGRSQEEGNDASEVAWIPRGPGRRPHRSRLNPRAVQTSGRAERRRRDRGGAAERRGDRPDRPDLRAAAGPLADACAVPALDVQLV